MQDNPNISTELLTCREASRWLRCSVSFLEKLRQRGEGPRIVRLGVLIRYRVADLEAWASSASPDAGGSQ